MSRIATLIMAAGGSTRFGGCKLLAPVNGMPLLRRSINTAQQVTPGHVFTVTGAWHEAIEKARIEESWEPSSFIYHHGWAQGLGSSIAAGVRYLVSIQAGYDAILVMLADQIDLTPANLAALTSQAAPRAMLCAAYGESCRGVPALFGSAHFDTLMRLNGDSGARQLLRSAPSAVVAVLMPSAAVDIDTPDALAAWHQAAIQSHSHDSCLTESGNGLDSTTPLSASFHHCSHKESYHHD
ncbi:nucleotidyltransferase family protein [Oceanimonas doudoroffii]|uniref:MobA-like NTP transferase domain-containing protein n=1 Tax=Oceanimonas doudoroffii TaxID=84158 RepID=A0A233RAZ0_9GAMM|nr:nucleotidyltransferase family protein [Oceanimonas doudoroffii]OXY80556.1 hypothetical protein B6S08_16730 [Oceanimonas doudoroffii]